MILLGGSQSPGPKLYPVEHFKDRKFVFRFYRDTRPEILNHPLWRRKT